MSKVFNHKRILSLLLALLVMFSFIFAFSNSSKIKAGTEYTYLKDYYTLTYKDNKLTLLFSPEVRDYESVSKSDIADLKDQISDILYSLVKDNLKENYKYNTATKFANDGLFRMGYNLRRLYDDQYNEVDVSLMNGILCSELRSVEAIQENFLNGTVYDTMISYYLDNYVTTYIASHPTAEHETILDIVEEQMLAAVQAQVNAVYNATYGVAGPDVSARVAELVATVRDAKDNGENIEITLSDVTDMMSIIDDSDTIVEVINTVDVSDHIQDVISNSTPEEITDFLTTVDVPTLVQVVEETAIINQNNYEEIITNVGIENLITIADAVEVDGLIDLAKAAGLTEDDLTSALENAVQDISFDNLFAILKSVKLNESTVYSNGSLNADGLKDILLGLPKPAEIANFTDDQMRLSYDVTLETSLGTFSFELTVGFNGDCSKIRKAAQLVADYVDVERVNGEYNVTITAPEKFAKFVKKAIDSDLVSETLLKRVLDDTTLTFAELYELVEATSLDEYLALLKEVDYEAVLNTVLNAEDLNNALGTSFTNAQIDKVVDALIKVAKKAGTVDLESVVETITDRTNVNLGSLPTEKLQKALNKVVSILDDIAGGNLTAAKLREYAADPEYNLNEKVFEHIDDLSRYEENFNTLKTYLTKLYNKLPDSLKEKGLVNLYEGDGVFNYANSFNLREALQSLLPSRDFSGKGFVERVIEKLPSNLALNLTLNLNGFYQVEFNYGDDTKTLFLPAGSDVVKTSGVSDVDGYAIAKWVDENGDDITLTKEEDSKVFAIVDFEITPSADVNKEYDGENSELSVTVLPDDTYSYKWFKSEDGVTFDEIDGATEATLNVKNVSDSGTYYCQVSTQYLTKDSDHITVAISKKVIDVSGLTWADAAGLEYNGELKEILITNVPDTVTPAYTGNKESNAGSYVAKVEFTPVDPANYEVSGSVADLNWSIAKAKINVSGLTWANATGLVYNGEVKEILLTNVPNTLTPTYTGNKESNAGNYVAKVTFTPVDANNYQVEGSVADLNWSIEKATIDVSGLQWNYTSPLVYNGQVQTVTLNNVPNNVSVAYINNAKSEVGSYVATATFTSTNNNYKVSPTSLTLNWVIQAAPNQKINVSGLTWNYDSTSPLVFTGQQLEVVLANVPEHLHATYTGNTGTNAGTYTANVTFTADPGYEVEGSVASLTWTINPAVINVSGLTWNYTSAFEYDGNAKKVELSNVPAGVTVNYVDNEKTAVGTYTAKANLVAADANHTVEPAQLTLNWEIKAKQEDKQTVFESNDGQIIVEVPNGLSRDYTLSITKLDDFSDLDISGVLARRENGRTQVAYEIHFVKENAEQHLVGKFTVKIALPEELKDVKFKIAHFADGVNATEVEYKIENGYIVFETDGFSVFAFVQVKKAPFVPIIIWIIIALEIIGIIILIIVLKKREKDEEEQEVVPVVAAAEEEQPAEEAPVEEQPAEEAPVEEQPAEEAPVEEQPAEEAPVEEQPAEEAPVEEQPAEEAPVEEQPAEEAPVEEQPTEEAPVEEQPAEEAPVEDSVKKENN